MQIDYDLTARKKKTKFSTVHFLGGCFHHKHFPVLTGIFAEDELFLYPKSLRSISTS